MAHSLQENGSTCAEIEGNASTTPETFLVSHMDFNKSLCAKVCTKSSEWQQVYCVVVNY